MTNREAIKELKLMRYNDANTGDMDRALAMAIEALSAQEKPYLWQKEMVKILSEQLDNNSTKVDNENVDLISRQDAIEEVEMLLEQSEDDEHDKTWNNAIRGAINAVKRHVPSAQRMGEWIHDGSDWTNRWICSKCGYKHFLEKTNYCPNCGADCRGGQDE